MAYKIRIWDKEKNEMWTNVLREMGAHEMYNDDMTMWEIGNSLEQGNTYRFIPMIFANKLDINKKEIYESDIVNFHLTWENGYGSGDIDHGYFIGYVEYTNYGFQVVYKDRNSKEFRIDLHSYNNYPAFEVLGNIYENPEFLEV